MTRRGCENAGYRRLFDGDGLTVGLGLPLTGVREETPPIDAEVRLAKRAESLGFDGLWARDVPTYRPLPSTRRSTAHERDGSFVQSRS